MKRFGITRGPALAGLALVVAILAGGVGRADPTCVQTNTGGEFCFGGEQTPGGGVSGGASGSQSGFGFEFGTFGSPPSYCSSHVCGSRPAYHWTGFGVSGPRGTDAGAELSGVHVLCTVCYEEYHVSGGGVQVDGRLCYSTSRTPPLYVC